MVLSMFPLVLLLLPLTQGSQLPIHSCCPEGQTLTTTSTESILLFGSSMQHTFCKTGHSAHALEGLQVEALDPSTEDTFPRTIRDSGSQDIDCFGSLVQTTFNLNNSGASTFVPDHNIHLRGGRSDNEGNVYIDGKPICDDGWGDNNAKVACRMLGYEHGIPRNGAFGRSNGDYGMDDVHCNGDESSLYDCRYNTRDDCSREETAGVVCSEFMGQSNKTLTVDGGLYLTPEDIKPPGSFCLSPLSATRVKAVQCSSSRSQIIGFLTDRLWGQIASHEDEYTPYDHPAEWLARNFVHMGDKDKSGSLSTKEWNDFANGNIKVVFDILDGNDNGYLESTEGKFFENIPFELLDAGLLKAFTLFDFSENNLLSFNEDMRFSRRSNGLAYEDRDEDGVVSLEDIFRAAPVTWPAPLYKFYTLLDADGKGDLSLTEARNFLERTFTVADTNKDCKINIDELVRLADTVGFSKSYGLAVKLILKQYTTVLSYLLTDIINKADSDQDGKTTFQEILSVSDWDWADKLAETVAMLGYPNMGPIYYLGGEDMFRRRGRRREDDEKLAEMLFKALETLLDQPAYTGEVQALCNNFIPMHE